MAKSREGTRYREGKDYCWRKRVGSRGDVKTYTIKALTHSAREDRVREKLAELAAGVIPTAPLTVEVFIARWLEEHIKPNRAYKTHASYAQVCKLYVYPVIGSKRLYRLTTSDVQGTLNAMTDKKLSARTVTYARQVLRTALAQAKAEGLVARNVATSAKVPISEGGPKRVLTDEEAARLTKYTGTRFAPLFCFLLATGLRVSEALGLTHENITDAGVVVENQLAWRSKGKFTLERLKTKASRRVVPLSPLALAALMRMNDIRVRDMGFAKEGYTSFGLIFSTESGKPSTQSNAHRALRAAITDLKIKPSVSVHDLRRTFLTRLARVESRPQVLKAIAGHTSLATTMQFYINSNTSDELDAVTRASIGL